MTCVGDGCDKPAAPGGTMCWACYKHHERTGTTRRKRHVRHPNAKAMVLEAVNNLADVDPLEDSAWNKALARFWMAILRYRRRTGTNGVQKRSETHRRG